jgi:hypothetical protein
MIEKEMVLRKDGLWRLIVPTIDVIMYHLLEHENYMFLHNIDYVVRHRVLSLLR